MAQWLPVFVLPNVRLDRTIEGNFVAIVDNSDERVTELANNHRRFSSFLSRFTNAFGVQSPPSVLLVRADAPKHCLDVSALAGFRDLVSVSTVAKGRALQQIYRSSQPIQWANTFDFYPWMIDKNYEYLVANTPGLLALHEVRKFRGQCAPEVARMELRKSDVDDPLVAELVARWDAHYSVGGKRWANLALFRALNMANQACLMPTATATTVYDVGRCVGLWISAFEILVHPGANGRADLSKVIDLLEQTAWTSRFPRLFNVGKNRKGTIASWLYRRMYDVRNAFLHGNPVARRDLLLKPGGRGVLNFCAPLFRIALTSFLDLQWKEAVPEETTNDEALMDYTIRRSDFRSHQKIIERALQSCRLGPDD